MIPCTVRVVNMMPYTMNIYEDNTRQQGPMFVYEKSGLVARIVTVELGTVQGPELWYRDVQYQELESFPDEVAGTYYIVSLAAGLAVRSRDDLLAPYKKVRDLSGRILGYKHLQRIR